jgi:hypothetical protein
MSWIDQGRQYHMWFGHGTAAGGDAGLEQRVAAVAGGAIAAFSPAERQRAEAQLRGGSLRTLTQAMLAWASNGGGDRAGFAERFFGRDAGDPAVGKLRAAAAGAAAATSQTELREAAGKLAAAMKTVGLDRWPRFLADAGERAAREAAGAGRRQVADASPAGARTDAGGATEADALPPVAQALRAAEEAAYDAYPNDCSHAVWELLKQTGHPDEPYRTANDLMDMVAKPNSGWRQVTMAEASRLAEAGKVTIGGRKEPKGSGHVLGVWPGAWKQAGGFMAGGKWIEPTHEQYPLAMSGAMSAWPGARSRGERTVQDPWGGKGFRGGTFWTREP